MAKKFLFSWPGFFEQKLVSATIEDAAPTDVVLTFKDVRPFRNAVKTDFTIATKTVGSIAVDASAKTVTVVVTAAFAYGDTPSVVFTPPIKGEAVTQVITNNILDD
jgi:hypothetical protein